MKSRAERRHHRQRILDRWSRIADLWEITDESVRYPEGQYGWVVRTAENMPVCSSPGCCGNPRKRGEKTRQEIKADQDEKQQLEDLEGT